LILFLQGGGISYIYLSYPSTLEGIITYTNPIPPLRREHLHKLILFPRIGGIKIHTGIPFIFSETVSHNSFLFFSRGERKPFNRWLKAPKGRKEI
jgi:hypothetical protein